MKRKLLSLFAAFLLLITLPLSARASEELPLIVDNAGLFTREESEALDALARDLQSEYEMDVVILTVDSLDGQRPQDYAENYYLAKGYGYGSDYSGILFLLAMEARDWYVLTCGDAIYALTDYGIQASAQEALSCFGEGDYFGGFHAWLNVLPAYLDAYQSDAPADGYADYSGDYYHSDQDTAVRYTPSPDLSLSLLIGLAVAAISIFVMRFAMNSKRPQRTAASYLTEGSYHLRTHQDLFLYSNITKRARPKENTSGGGSSVHSSGGRKFGGGGGKF